jgi:hypothetical protein
MPEPGIITDLSQRIVRILDIEPEWTVQVPGAIGFVAGEVGVLLTVRGAEDWPAVLRVEARLARHAPDEPETWEFCHYLNSAPELGSLGGRWVHDPASGVVALVADLPVPEEPGLVGLYAEFVALLACRAEIAACNSIPQQKIGAGKALTLVAGRRRTIAHPLLDRLTETRRGGGDPAPVRAVVDLVQQNLPEGLVTWSGQGWYSAREDRLELWSGYGTVLALDVAENPRRGWGIMIGAGFLLASERRDLIADGVVPGVLDFPRITSGYLVGGASHRRRT